MRTLVTLENSNCTWCHNAMLATLREKKGVHRVRSEFQRGRCVAVAVTRYRRRDRQDPA
jgi:hypothetical protein